MTQIQLSDAQSVILSAACARDDRMVFPVTASLKGGAVGNVCKSLLKRGLIEEVAATDHATVWRHDEARGPITLRATPLAHELLGIGDAPDGDAPAAMTIDEAFEHAARETAAANDAPSPRAVATRDGTKQSTLIALLRRPEGATLAEMAEATQWQVHTCRGAMAGALKKRLGLEVTSEKTSRGRTYRLPPV